MMVDSMDPLMEKMNTAVNKHTDVELVRGAMPAALIQLDGLIEASPDNTGLLARAAEAYNGYTFVFLEGNDNERARRLYLRAHSYAMRALKQETEFAEAVNAPVDVFEASLSVFDKKDVPALFWAATSWLSWAGLSVDDPEIFLALPKIHVMLKRCIELDENYKYGIAHAVMGVLYASRPVAYGGNPDKAKEEFDRAFELSNRKMLVFILTYAQYYAYQIQDKELYIRTLQEVIDAPDDLFPAMGFINAAAKIKAKSHLENVDKLF
jgi:tetratricopeptide (TPR) repeat protein